MFADNFTGANGQHLESRPGWTRVGGVAGALQITGNQLETTVTNETSYLCPDQGSADQLVMFTLAYGGALPSLMFVTVRHLNANNFIGVRYLDTTTGWELYKRDTNSFTLLGSYSPGASSGSDVCVLSAVGNNLTVSINGVNRIGPVVDAAHNTVTRQGLLARGSIRSPWIDHYYADVATGAAIINTNLSDQLRLSTTEQQALVEMCSVAQSMAVSVSELINIVDAINTEDNLMIVSDDQYSALLEFIALYDNYGVTINSASDIAALHFKIARLRGRLSVRPALAGRVGVN